MSPEERRARGERAERLMNDELMVEAFAGVEAAYKDAWAGSRPDETQKREGLYYAMGALQRIRDHLGIVIADGKLAAADLEKEQENGKA